jgi:D-lactate dehydrogenase (cytochrome)
MRDNVIGVTAVLADGSIARLGGRARKSSAGYDLTRLLVGSEGTLGVITEVALRLYPVPEAVSAAVCTFHSMQVCWPAAPEISGCLLKRHDVSNSSDEDKTYS